MVNSFVPDSKRRPIPLFLDNVTRLIDATSTLTSRPIILSLVNFFDRFFESRGKFDSSCVALRCVALRSIETGKRERERGMERAKRASERVSVRDRDKNWRARTRDFLVSLFFPLTLNVFLAYAYA